MSSLPVIGPVALPPRAFATVAPPAAIVTIAATIPTTATILFRRITSPPLSRSCPEVFPEWAWFDESDLICREFQATEAHGSAGPDLTGDDGRRLATPAEEEELGDEHDY
jgi:hypothetical protein